MANITAAQVKDLREKTGAGMMDAKNALVEANGESPIVTLGGVGSASAASTTSSASSSMALRPGISLPHRRAG